MEEPDVPYPTQKDNSKLKGIILISLAGIGVLGGVFIFRKPEKIEATKIVVTPIKYKQLSNSPTVKQAKIKKDVTIHVLNGTGIRGQAGIIVKALGTAGYSLGNIKSGNTETIGETTTTITSRADFAEIVNDIKDVLKPVYPDIMNGISNSNPNEDSGFDVIITTGGKKTDIAKKTPTPIISP